MRVIATIPLLQLNKSLGTQNELRMVFVAKNQNEKTFKFSSALVSYNQYPIHQCLDINYDTFIHPITSR